MPHPRSLGYHAASKRSVYLLSLDSLGAGFTIPACESQPFTCICAMDATAYTATVLREFCGHLLRSGCAYLCTWGPDCERVHDIMDQEVVGENPLETYVRCMMTTWHEKESLIGALEYFFDCTLPDSDFAPNGCEWAVIISVGSPGWGGAVERYVAQRTVPIAS